ncbi:MAG: DUF2061 domain-containing protein [Promethearchaeota archaeon]|nr:MAG: DUF2061 domain-containing protein [Candidatus Lokiarchaeota archaeon]
MLVDWKRSIIKTIIYRIITLFLGTLTAYIGTGDIASAGGVALLTEAVQSVNYFIYEAIWSHYEERRLRREIEEEMINREIEMTINLDFLRDLSYELSRMDTFVADVYSSIIDFYNRLLKNEEIQDIHDEVLKHKAHFKKVHEGRNFPDRDELEDIIEYEAPETAKEQGSSEDKKSKGKKEKR